MEFTDLETFRSKYSDLTVTAVPAKRQKLDAQPENLDAAKHVEKSPTALVEIIPIIASNAAASTFQQSSKRITKQEQQQLQFQQQQQLQQAEDDVAYSNEYRQVLAKLEYTKYAQAQLQLMSASNGIAGNSYDSNDIGGNSYDSNGTSNIVDVYDNLLSVIAEMQSCLGPTAMGLRAPKERLLRDIGHARVLVRECILMLMHNQ
ncbi:uncharacterized protein LOC6562738 [Drosophila grimshawi]|uniref:GH10153 n=1 Tax=Drosophila grimshawi TaxID=7222 RepID=B4JC89_DROGR|nr:uncharacterized protein LOC6562738 [Drosophila grimshawi]EDW04122.1 GH10153 [Drosophila grimshawi]